MLVYFQMHARPYLQAWCRHKLFHKKEVLLDSSNPFWEHINGTYNWSIVCDESEVEKIKSEWITKLYEIEKRNYHYNEIHFGDNFPSDWFPHYEIISGLEIKLNIFDCNYQPLKDMTADEVFRVATVEQIKEEFGGDFVCQKEVN